MTTGPNESRYFKEEHEIFRRSLRSFIDRELSPHAEEWEEAETFPNEVFKKMGQLGYLGASFPVEHGGAGGDVWYNVVRAQELPYCRSGGVVTGLIVQSDAATPIISKLGTPEQIEEFLKPALAGDRISAIGVTEPDAGSDVAALRTTAKKDGGDYVINGSKTFITNGTRADFITLAVKTNPDSKPPHMGISFVLLPTDTKGFTVTRKLKKMGLKSSDTAELAFDNCRIPQRYLLGQEGQGFFYIMSSFLTERLSICIGTVSAMKMVIADAIRYGEQRSVMGKVLTKYQYNRHRLAEMLTEAYAMEAMTLAACRKYAAGQDPTLEVSMAKLIGGKQSHELAQRCMQFYGGYAYMEEFPIARYYRDSKLMAIGGGAYEVMLLIISRLMDQLV